VLIFGEAHLRRILSSHAAYYNEVPPAGPSQDWGASPFVFWLE